MVEVYKSIDDRIQKLAASNLSDSGVWINLVNPSEQEILYVSQKLEVPIDFIKAPLDEEETSRIEVEGDNILVILDIPYSGMEENSLVYETYPLGIIHTKDALITIMGKSNKIINDFIDGKVKSFYTFKRSRFILQILYRISNYYLIYLRQIYRKSSFVENRLHKSMKNKELLQLLALEKSLVFFSTSLKGNEVTLEKMLKLSVMQKYQEDQDILEDVIIETKQAIEMTIIYSNILNGTMDAFASIISNNLNIVMKFLATVTIILSVPTMVSGFFGMNVGGIPFASISYGFPVVVLFTTMLCLVVAYVLYKKDYF